MHIVHTEDYKKLRRKSYPDIGDQLDELWRLLAAATPDQIQDNALYQKVQAVKNAFPKPAPGTLVALGDGSLEQVP